jgi:hypothetical protein
VRRLVEAVQLHQFFALLGVDVAAGLVAAALAAGASTGFGQDLFDRAARARTASPQQGDGQRAQQVGIISRCV